MRRFVLVTACFAASLAGSWACGSTPAATTATAQSSSHASSSSASSTTSSATASASSGTTASAGGAGGQGAGGAGGSGGSGGQGGLGGQGGSGGQAGSGGQGGQGGGVVGTRVRVACGNLTSGNAQSYDPGEGLRILQGLSADVLLVQELNIGGNTMAELTAFTQTACGASCAYVRGPVAAIPNGILTRLPILDSGSWTDPQVSNRDFVWARLDAPGPIDLWAISVHLLSTGPTERDAEAVSLLASIQSKIPAGDYVVLGGDFNTKVRDEAALMTLDPLFDILGPYPADQMGNDNTSGPRTRPYDWVLTSDVLSARRVPVVIGPNHFSPGAVIDTRVYTPILDLAPALTTDSGALNMQHMAVVKDFAL